MAPKKKTILFNHFFSKTSKNFLFVTVFGEFLVSFKRFQEFLCIVGKLFMYSVYFVFQKDPLKWPKIISRRR